MKKIIGINASPRKNCNTAQVVEKALEGAKAAGAETKMVQLYGLNFKGCASCFACKKKEKTADLCVVKDDLQPVLQEVMAADAIIVGAPIYYSNLNASCIAFFERLLFMNFTYDPKNITKCRHEIASALICTMNVDEKTMEEWGYPGIMNNYTRYLNMVLRGPSELLTVNDTLQFSDYSRYIGSMFDPEHKKKVHEEQFPRDLEKAFELGRRLAA